MSDIIDILNGKVKAEEKKEAKEETEKEEE